MNADYLALVVEEAGEVLQAIGKIQRFGPTNWWDKEELTNLEALAYEIGDLLEVIERLDLPKHLIEAGRRRKRERLKRYGPEIVPSTPDVAH